MKELATHMVLLDLSGERTLCGYPMQWAAKRTCDLQQVTCQRCLRNHLKYLGSPWRRRRLC